MAIGSIVIVRPRPMQRGFTYLGMMFLIFVIGIGLAAAGTAWQTEVQREKEKELLFIGGQYATAIGSYYESTPNGPKRYPLALEDMLQDNRFPVVRRHLRKLYSDPVTGGEEWGLVREQGRITGVYSLSPQRPLKKAGFPAAWAAFAEAGNYAAWQFIYAPGTLQVEQQSQPETGVSSGDFLPVQSGNMGSGSGLADGATPNPGSPDTGADITRQQTCLGQRVSDTAACSFYCKTKGSGTKCSQCQASALKRYGACLKGDSLPPLADGD